MACQVVGSIGRFESKTKEKEMTTAEKLIDCKLNLLGLAEYPSNVSVARRIHGISRQNFYGIKKAHQEGDV